MNRYLVFAGDQYYPQGGWDDFRGSFEDLHEAIDRIDLNAEWWHIVDLETGAQVANSYTWNK